MFPNDLVAFCRSWRSARAVAAVAATFALVLTAVAGCGRIPGAAVVGDAADSAPASAVSENGQSQDPRTSDNPASGDAVNDDSGVAAPTASSEAVGPAGVQPGQAEKTELPAPEEIEGCDASSCSVGDTVTYEHLYQGAITVVLFADYSEDSLGACKVAVIDEEGNTAQLFPLRGVTAWSKRGSELAETFYFLDPPTDATQNIFFHMPDGDGWMASGLTPSSVGYFELFDLGYIGDDFSEHFASQPMVAVGWGELDGNGNYKLEIEDAVAQWNGTKYVAP